jgi:hypothetical protein
VRIVSDNRERLDFALDVVALELDSSGMARELRDGRREALIEMNRTCWAATEKERWLRLKLEGGKHESLRLKVGDEILSGASDIYLRACPDEWGEGDTTCMFVYTDAGGPAVSLTKQGWLRQERLVSSVTIAPAWFFEPRPIIVGVRSRLSPLAARSRQPLAVSTA